MPKTLQDYERDEVVDLLREFRFRSIHEPALTDEIDSVLALLEEQEDTDNDE